ncbi:hypothetical protein J3E68DRAFT_389352 [Trichoderma sp. SZMC 28012]
MLGDFNSWLSMFLCMCMCMYAPMCLCVYLPRYERVYRVCVFVRRCTCVYLLPYIHLLAGISLRIHLFCQLVAQIDYRCVQLLGEQI